MWRRALHRVAIKPPPRISQQAVHNVKRTAHKLLAKEEAISKEMAASILEEAHELKPFFGCQFMHEAQRKARARGGEAHAARTTGFKITARSDSSSTGPPPVRSVVGMIAELANTVDDLAASAIDLDAIAHEHVHFGVLSNDHTMLGTHFARTIGKHCGLTAEELAAWKQAHEVIADVLMRRECTLRQEYVDIMGGGHPVHNDIEIDVRVATTA